MSDTRFTMIGIGLIFAGFVVFGIFNEQYIAYTIEADEFGDCYEYFEEEPPVPIDCGAKLEDKIMFFGLVIGLIVLGVISLIKGVKGKWDQSLRPEDMVGPGGEKTVGDNNDEDSRQDEEPPPDDKGK